MLILVITVQTVHLFIYCAIRHAGDVEKNNHSPCSHKSEDIWSSNNYPTQPDLFIRVRDHSLHWWPIWWTSNFAWKWPNVRCIINKGQCHRSEIWIQMKAINNDDLGPETCEGTTAEVNVEWFEWTQFAIQMHIFLLMWSETCSQKQKGWKQHTTFNYMCLKCWILLIQGLTKLWTMLRFLQRLGNMQQNPHQSPVNNAPLFFSLRCSSIHVFDFPSGADKDVQRVA